MEKALLRSPEYSLSGTSCSSTDCTPSLNLFPVIDHFFKVYPTPCGAEAFRRILLPTLSASKSSNAAVREATIRLFAVLSSKIQPDDTKSAQLAATEILALPKAGKSNGPDHRVALYAMLAFIHPSAGVSMSIVQTVSALLVKETHDAATAALAAAAVRHLVFLLREGTAAPPELISVVTKEITSSKPALRRAVLSLVGSTVLALGAFSNDASAAFAKAVHPGLEASLKSIATASSAGSALDGYIPTALLLGPYSRSGKYGKHNVNLTYHSFHFNSYLR